MQRWDESWGRLGVFENTLVIYTADHGDALGSNGGDVVQDLYELQNLLESPGNTRYSHGDAPTPAS